MPFPPPRLIRAFDRFNAAHPWSHNAHYHRWLLRQLPRRFGRALDVGSGTGDLALLLAGRARDEVVGIDADPRVVERAREAAAGFPRVRFEIAEAPRGLPAGPFAVVTCVAALHHLPCGEALAAFRDRLAPGGTLVVVGLARSAGRRDRARDLLVSLLNVAVGWWKTRGRRVPRPASMTAPTREPRMTLDEIAAEAGRTLPGARLRRRLFWRYTLVWRSPADRRAV
jgi:SAM-dependent methyltransferase